MAFVHPELLIEPEALAAQGSDPALRVFDATVFLRPASTGYRAESGLQRYREGHVPGAAFMDLIQAFSDTTSGLGFTLPSHAALCAAIGQAGIGPAHRVVVYASGHLMWATRAFWLLRWAGHQQVQVLNGGLDAWRAAGLPIATGDAHYPPTTFTGTVASDWFTDLAGMQAASNTPGVCTVNALSPAMYAGTGDMHYGRRGHIPGSRNLHYDALLDEGRFAEPARVATALRDAGLLSAERVVAYCGGGISATVDAFACLLMGHPKVSVYDGSMSEWVRNPDLPLTTGDAP
ncbi:MAG: sulfurtransferase [Gammaproteobacteria bacterium]